MNYIILIVMIAYLVLSIVLLIRWWKMTSDIKKIKEHITASNPKIIYLMAIGEKEQAQKAALKLLVDALYPIYYDEYVYNKADDMNKFISERLPKIQRLGIEVPEYVTSGEKFIDYMNSISGNKVAYRNSPYATQQ